MLPFTKLISASTKVSFFYTFALPNPPEQEGGKFNLYLVVLNILHIFCV